MFNDDDNNLWESSNDDDEEEEKEEQELPSLSRMNHLSNTTHTSASVINKKTPLKLIIKRLQHPTISTEIKYKSHTVHTLLPLIT